MKGNVESFLLLIESIIWLVVTIFMYRGLYKNQPWKNTSGKMLTYRVLTVIGLIISIILLGIKIYSKLTGKFNWI